MNKKNTLAIIHLLERSKSHYTILLFTVAMAFASCQEQDHDHAAHEEAAHSQVDSHDHTGHDHSEEGHEEMAELNASQVESLGLKFGKLEPRNMSAFVRTNGRLQVPPQNKASVTAIIGANIQSVAVIPGEVVKKGQTLATISHPDLIRVQTEYTQHSNELDYLAAEYARQEKLYQEEVGSGKEFQKVKSEYLTMKGRVKGLESQLKQLNLDPKSIKNGDISETVSITSPIDGSVNAIGVNIGQYVAPETTLFEVIDNHHIHVDLLVYEKDIAKIEKGQEVLFHTESAPETEFPAVIFAVGTTFEQDSKAVSVHAEILGDKPKVLLPGMYVKGRILLAAENSLAVPESAVVRDGEAYIIFAVEEEMEGREKMYHFTPIEVMVGVSDSGWTEVKPLKAIDESTQIVLNQAYFLLAEMDKGEGGHEH
ncbi:efflux RND transporter periplasmic adaptor subunit [Cryomorphaceae bacterium 1068]|nr:efflux RND transporter periplasmic adaptor subunit [Cryomorphaceae bacterium 1068]